MFSEKLLSQLLLSLVVLVIGLIAVICFLVTRPPDPQLALELAQSDPEVRQEVVQHLVDQTTLIYDAFPDPQVGYLLMPGLVDRPWIGKMISSNRWGMREREYAMPKDPGTVRVVFLGDSYVFGNAVDASVRVGIQLENILRGGTSVSPVPPIECLHLGVPSWNLVAEANYVLRQLHLLQPDMVVQVAINNDLNDIAGIRGFSGRASFSPAFRARGSGMIHQRWPINRLGFKTPGFLLLGMDFQSAHQYRQAGAAMQRLARAQEASGGHYLLLLNWFRNQPLALQFFGEFLEDNQMLQLPVVFAELEELRVSPRDAHWSAKGHQQVALYLYAALQQTGCLPMLGLKNLPNATRTFEGIQKEVRDERLKVTVAIVQSEHIPESDLNFRQMDDTSASHVHGGIYPDGETGAFASVIVARNGGRRLVIEGSFLGSEFNRPDPSVEISVDGQSVGRATGTAGAPFRFEKELPPESLERPYLTIWMRSQEFVYGGPDLRFTLSHVTERLAIE